MDIINRDSKGIYYINERSSNINNCVKCDNNKLLSRWSTTKYNYRRTTPVIRVCDIAQTLNLKNLAYAPYM